MDIPKIVASRVIYPLKDAPLRRSTLRVLAALQASERLPKDRLDELRAARLQRLIRHAYAHVPYYRALFTSRRLRPEDITQPSDLGQLPVLTREIVRERRADLVADAAAKGYTQTVYTSGSTGEPLSVLADAHELSARLANQLRGKSWHGIEIGDPEVRISLGAGAALRTTALARAFWTANAIKDRLLNIHKLPAGALSDRALDQWDRVIRRRRPVSLYGYAASLFFFARYLRARGGPPPPRVPTVILAGEKIHADQKEVIADVFGANVVEEYGSADCGIMAFQCERGRFHTSDESAVFEIAGRDSGGLGELLVTSLTNYSMPLIRYRIGDVAGLSAETCACGRSLGVMSEVVGRTADYFVDAQGAAVNPFRLVAFLQHFEAVERYRLVQPAAGAVEILAQMSRDLTADELGRIRREFAAALGSDTRVAIRRVDVLPAAAPGKHRFVSSLITGAGDR